MRKLGLVGGMGPESTLVYYHDLVYGVMRKLGRDEFPPLTIESVNVFRMLGYEEEDRLDDLVDYLSRALDHLAAAGADFAALSANTPHVVFGQLRERSGLPLVSIIECARDEAVARGYHRIGLLGTTPTMTRCFFKEPFKDAGIEVVTPDMADAALVARRISDELEHGIKRPATLVELQRIIADMQTDKGIESIVLGCTELPMLLSDETSPVPCLDTLRIHVDTLVDMILGERDLPKV